MTRSSSRASPLCVSMNHDTIPPLTSPAHLPLCLTCVIHVFPILCMRRLIHSHFLFGIDFRESPLHLGLRGGGSGQVPSKSRTPCSSAWYTFRRARGSLSSGPPPTTWPITKASVRDWIEEIAGVGWSDAVMDSLAADSRQLLPRKLSPRWKAFGSAGTQLTAL